MAIFFMLPRRVLASTINLNVNEIDNWPGYTIDVGITAIADNTTASDEINEPAVTNPAFPNYAITHTFWYKFSPTESKYYVASTCAAGGPNTIVNLYEAGNPDALPNLVGIGGEDGVSVGTPCGVSAVLEHYLESGKTYYYQVGSVDGANLGTINFSLYPVYPVVFQGSPWSTSTSQQSFTAHILAGFEPDTLSGAQFQLESGSWQACSADDGNFDIVNDVEAVSCNITGLTVGQVNNIKFRAIGNNNVQTQPSDYLELALTVSAPTGTLSLTNKSQYLSAIGNFVFLGTATGNGQINSVQWRQYAAGQGAETGWTGCSPDDGTFDSTAENYTCTIPTPTNEGTYYYEIRTTDSLGSITAHVYPVGLVDTSKKVDNWFSFNNILNAGQTSGFGRTFGSIVVNGSPVLTTGKFGDGAVEFQGTSWFEMPDTFPYLDYSGANRSFSITARIKPSASGDGTNRTILFKQAPDLSSSYWTVWIDTEGKIESRMQIGTNHVSEDTNNKIQSSGAVNLDSWNDIEVRWDITNKIACIKLNAESARCTAWLFSDPVLPSLGSLFVGGGQETPFSFGNFIGEIDDIQINRTGDATPPIVQISSISNSDRVTNATPAIQVSFDDENGGVASAEYFIATATVGPGLNSWEQISTPTDGEWGGTTESATIISPHLGDGVATVTVRSKDINGNSNVNFAPYTSNFFEANYSFNIETVDSTAPRIYLNAVQPNPNIDRQPAIRGYVKDYEQVNFGDSTSNITEISYSLDGGDFGRIDTIDGNYDSPKEDFYFQIPQLTIGQHTIRIRAIDSSGNSTANNAVDGPNGDATLTFSVDNQPESTTSQTITKNITFDNHDLHDSIFSDAVWGNGVVRLRQKINFSEAIDFSPIDHDVFGYNFGDSSLSVFGSTDGNVWIAGTDGSVSYYNTVTKAVTKYDKSLFKGESGRIYKIFEFEDGGNRYLLVHFKNNVSTMVYDINNTPENVADDPVAVDYQNKAGLPSDYAIFNPYSVDTRGATQAIYGTMYSTLNGGENVIRIDMKGTPMNLADDTYTLWGHTQGLSDDSNGVHQGGITSFYFDQTQNKFLAFQDSMGMYVCDDKGTPTNTADDSCTTPWTPGAVATDTKVFSIVKDPNGWYWTGGDNGLTRMDLKNTANRSDDVVEVVLDSAAISGDQISEIKWIPGVAPVGDEVWAMTRQGRVRAIEYNSTYNDSQDDTNYAYKINKFDYRSGSNSTFYMQDRNTIWVGVPGQGMDKISLDRTYDDTNTIEIYPVPPLNLLEVNHVLLSDVVGTVSSGSSHAFGDLVTYEVSNNAGVTWKPAQIGDIIDFSTSDYKLKIRITLHKGSTPIIQSMSLAYVAQPKGTILAEINSGNNSNNSQSGGGGSQNNQQNNRTCNSPKPIKSPDLFQITARTNTAKMYFSPLPDTNNFVIGYSTKPGAEEYGAEVTLFKEGVQNFTINLLKPNTTYYIKIRGQIGCMPGEWSNTMKITTQPKGSNRAKDFYKSMTARLVASSANLVSRIFKTPTKTSIEIGPSPTPVTFTRTIEPTSPPIKSPVKKVCVLWWCF